MRIELLTLCDAAVEVNGRLHILGTIDYFWAAALPYIHPKCALALRLRWLGYTRQSKHYLRIQFVDADGYTIANDFTQKIVMMPPADVDIPQIRNVILSYEGLRFASYGPYAVRVEVDGQEVTSLPFSVVSASKLRHRRTV